MTERHSTQADPVLPDDVTVEPERYELFEPLPHTFNFSRREFLGAAGAGVVVLIVLRNTAQALSGDGVNTFGAPLRQQGTNVIGAWLHIGEDGKVTGYTGKVEVGQDIRTSLAQHIAEELRLDPATITMVMGDTDLTPFDQGTFGSRSTPQMGTQLRRAAAAARNTLAGLAAEQWKVNSSELTFTGGRISHTASGRTGSIGEFTRGERLVQSIAGDTPVTAAGEWSVLGTPVARVTGRAIVTGQQRFTADMRLPGMLIGMVLRPPAMGSRLISLDSSAARGMSDVVVVHDGDFAGVAAPDELSAARALASLRAQWSSEPQPSHREIFEYLKRESTPGRPSIRGSVDAALTSAEISLSATYATQYIAHVPLEPRAAVAHWENGGLSVWTGTQRPFGVRSELANAFRIPEDRVRVRVPDTGSGYGGKHTGECAVEAARLARAANRPVRLVWTREEEFSWAYFRPAAVIDVRSAVRRDGTLTAWDFANCNSGSAGLATPYDVANVRTVFNQSNTPLRQGSYRALASVANTFARETHMDELAEKVGMDPLQFRLHNLRNDRLRGVLSAAATRFGWSGQRPTAGRGTGIACGFEKGGYVATCAEVEVDGAGGEVRVTGVTVAFECGAIVNPAGLHKQVEGCIIMGLGGALWEGIEFESGRVLNARLSQYRVPRLRDIPPIEVVLLDRKDLPSAGAGEAPIVALAPAIGSAIHMATGSRIRSLPLTANGVAAAGS
jgi:isoquinoline 1-oxidoreductase